MQIFEQEKLDGLEEKIQSSASFIYVCDIDKACKQIGKKEIKSIAGLQDKDLYYTQSILVSTTWNKNDDIFNKQEVWNAKDTPQHKPTNIEHQETQIVGHIVANWPITSEGLIIDKDTPIENLPDKFHVLTASVIYTGFTDPELKQRTEKLISEIEEGNKYVSMECFFSGFDYGLMNKTTGSFQILPRNEETSFLTKHLRSYGGFGEYEDHKIGRVLKNITFSGKGFVDKPANPESIIFQKEEFKFLTEDKNSENQNKGVFLIQANKQEADMSSNNLNTNDKVEAMNDCTELVKEAYAARDEFKAQASELETSLKNEQEAIAELKAALDALASEKEQAMKMADEDKKKKKEEMEKMKAELDAANEVLAVYKSKEQEMMKKEKNMKRMASLIEVGLNNEAAASEVVKFDSLADEAFDNMVNLLAAMKMQKDNMKKKDEEEAMMMKKKASENLSEALENVQSNEEVDLSVGSDDTEEELNNTRAALVDFVYNRLGKTLNKGE
jgi:chemotaxis protein histidine kinase CheA